MEKTIYNRRPKKADEEFVEKVLNDHWKLISFVNLGYTVFREFKSTPQKRSHKKSHTFFKIIRKHRAASRNHGIKVGPRRSAGEEELAKFIRRCGFRVVQGDRTVIKPKEIDVYVPSVKVGFEYNGDYWHSDSMVRATHKGISARKYHRNKVKAARAAGVTLYFVWENDWKKNPEAVKQAILISLTKGKSSSILTKVTTGVR